MNLKGRGAAASRSGLLVGLLLSSVGLAGVLTWEAQRGMREQQAMGERVLRDYAMLAADEFARRSLSELGFHGFYQAIGAVRRAAAWGSLPAPGALAADEDEEARSSADLVAATLYYDPATRRLDVLGEPLDPATSIWITRRLDAGITGPMTRAPYVTAHAVVGGRAHSIVFIAMARQPRARLLGFAAASAAFAPRFQRAFDQGPLYPRSLGAVGNQSLFLRVMDPAGREVFRAGTRHEPYLGIERPYNDDYNGLLKGFKVKVAVDPAAAGALVIGGLPRSRLPFLLVLLVLSAALSTTAMLQLRREQALARLRADFVSRVSHELRTPLAQIRMFTETLLLARVRSEEESRHALEVVDRESRRLANLVENVLRFSRAERGLDSVDVRPLDVVPVVRQTVEDFTPLAAGSARLTTALPARATALADAAALRQILLNLLDNAVKYGPRGQEIAIELTANARRVRLTVADQGPGVPALERELIWQRYYRLRRDLESAVAGTGIGLAVVRELAGLLGGHARVETGAPRGARFAVELRTAPSSGEEDAR